MDSWFEQESWYQSHREEIDKVWRSMWLLWLAFLGEPAVFVVLIWGFGARLRQGFATDASVPLASIRAVLIVLAIGTLILSVMIRRYMLRPPAQSQVNSPDSPLSPYALLYRNKAMLPAVMATTPATIGLVLFLLGDSLFVFFGFVLAAVLGLLWHHPRKDELIAFCQECESTSMAGRDTAS